MTKEENVTFEDLNLSKKTFDALMKMGFEAPSPIQAKTIPHLLAGKDVIGQAQTGTGKTAAFGIPIVEMVDPKAKTPQALILCPTRELAIQVAEEMNKIGLLQGVKALPIYGGQSISRQIDMLRRGVQVIVGTPGRVIDHLQRKTLKLHDLKMFVLDEADEMLDMGFSEDIEKIFKKSPEEKQCLLFSATMPKAILKLTTKYIKNGVNISITPDVLTAPKINQIFFEVRESEKIEVLTRLIESEESDLFLVFCHTKKEVDEVAMALMIRGFLASAIHGDYSQSQRESVMKKFKQNKIEVLVATDVAARGIDISNITHVINYSLPQDPERYVHRIGRTGRAGREGVAVTFVTRSEEKQLRMIERTAKTKLKRTPVPKVGDIITSRIDNITKQVEKFKKAKNYGEYEEYAQRLLDSGGEPMEILSTLLKLNIEGYDDDKKQLPAPGGQKYGQKQYGGRSGSGTEEGMAKLFVTIGKEHNVTPSEIVKHISQHAGVDGRKVGKIKILDRFTFVEVPIDKAEKVISAINKFMLSGKKVKASAAKDKK